MTHARHDPIAVLDPERAAHRRAEQARRKRESRARRRAAQAPDAGPQAPVAQADPARLADPAVIVLMGAHQAPWRNHHGLRLPLTAGQVDALDGRWAGRPLGERLGLAHAAAGELARIPARKRGERSWRIVAAVLATLDRLIAAGRLAARGTIIPTTAVASPGTPLVPVAAVGASPPIGSERSRILLARIAEALGRA